MTKLPNDSTSEQIPYWNVNIPPSDHTIECPDYLANADDGDRSQLAVKDADYNVMSWSDVRSIIKSNRLDSFKRVPSDLHKYRKYMAGIKEQYGSVMSFILKERVKWDDLKPKGKPFEFPKDIRILRNDWPYGIDPKIVHIVVWTKFGSEEDPATGDLTPDARRQIDEYVSAVFGKEMDRDSIIWFKNWAALKSIRAVEHFHVMLYDPPSEFLTRLLADGLAAKSEAERTRDINANEPSDFYITSTIRYDPQLLDIPTNNLVAANPARPTPFYLLHLHIPRLQVSSLAFSSPFPSLTLESLETALLAHLAHLPATPHRVRIQLSPSNTLTFVSAPTPPLPNPLFHPASLPLTPTISPAWSILLSRTPTIPSLFTAHKTSHRPMYDIARTAAGIAMDFNTEILLWNEVHGRAEISEGSIATPWFWRGGWVTPRSAAGGNQGVTRMWGLQSGLGLEGSVWRDELKGGEVVWLSNGVRGWGWGRLEL